MKLLSTILLCITFIKSTSACDCNYGGPFLTMAPNTNLVALVKVTKFLTFKNIYDSKTPMSMEVEIIEIYRGIETRKKLIVWGDPGNLCRPYLSQFKERQYYVIAFDQGYPNYGNDGEKLTDYSISNCGAFWLSADMSKKTAFGDVDSKDQQFRTITLEKLRVALKTNGS